MLTRECQRAATKGVARLELMFKNINIIRIASNAYESSKHTLSHLTNYRNLFARCG